jgi:Pentapeptide repeats (8 copies)
LLVGAVLLCRAGWSEIGRVDTEVQRARSASLVKRCAETLGQGRNSRAGKRVSDPAGKLLLPGGAATIVYADGACSVNPGRGGWAWAVPQGRYARGEMRYAGANLRGAMLGGADLQGAFFLDRASLQGARASKAERGPIKATRWPEGWTQKTAEDRGVQWVD